MTFEKKNQLNTMTIPKHPGSNLMQKHLHQIQPNQTQHSEVPFYLPN